MFIADIDRISGFSIIAVKDLSHNGTKKSVHAAYFIIIVM